MDPNEKIICDDKLNIEEIVNLMKVYRDEWQYRDSAFMSSFLKFSIMSLSITFFPYLINKIGMSPDSPLLSNIHPIIFSVFGIISALFGLLYSCAEAKRIEKIDLAYQCLMDRLPEYARVQRLKNEIDHSENIFRKVALIRLNTVLYWAYIIPIGLAILNIIFIIL